MVNTVLADFFAYFYDIVIISKAYIFVCVILIFNVHCEKIMLNQ